MRRVVHRMFIGWCDAWPSVLSAAKNALDSLQLRAKSRQHTVSHFYPGILFPAHKPIVRGAKIPKPTQKYPPIHSACTRSAIENKVTPRVNQEFALLSAQAPHSIPLFLIPLSRVTLKAGLLIRHPPWQPPSPSLCAKHI